MNTKYIFISSVIIVVLHGGWASPLADESDTPEIGDLLKSFGNGGFNINTLKTLFQGFHLASSWLNQISKISPFVRTVIQESAKKNIKMKVLEEMVNGKYPDLGQLFKLATTKTDPLSVDWMNAAEKYPGWSLYFTASKEDYTKPEVLTELIQFITGKKISKSSASVDAFNKLHKIAVYFYNNIHKIDHIHSSIFSGKVNYADLVKDLEEMPTAQLISDLSTGSKYTVASPKKKTNDLGGELSKQYKTLVSTPLTSDKLAGEFVQLFGTFVTLVTDLVNQATLHVGSSSTTN